MKILNKTKVGERRTLQYIYEGNEWCQIWEQKFDASALLLTNHAQELGAIRQQVKDGKLSPLACHLYRYSFDMNILSAYMGLSKRVIKKHLKPEIFNQLDEKILKKYAAVLKMPLEELKTV